MLSSGPAVGATNPGGRLRASRLCVRMRHLPPEEHGAWYTGSGSVAHSPLKSGRKLVAKMALLKRFRVRVVFGRVLGKD